MKKREKALLSVVVIGALGSIAAFGVFGFFSATTQNAGNEITTGTVALTDNDGGQAMFNISNAQPGQSWTRCIKVSYNGSLPSDVHMYLQRTPGPLEDYLNMKVEQGTQSSSTFPSCTGFQPDATGTIFDYPMTLADGDYASGLPTSPAGQTTWSSGDSIVYRVTMTLASNTPNTAQAASTGTVTAVWEARNDS